MSKKDDQSFASFCKEHKLGSSKMKWNVVGDKTVTITMNEEDMEDGGWGLISMGLMFALRELHMPVDITLRKSNEGRTGLRVESSLPRVGKAGIV